MTNTSRAVLCALFVVAMPAHAQSQPDRPAESVVRVATGAFLGGAGGLLLGGVVGGYVGGNDCSDEGNPDSCRLIAGVLVGSAVGVTLGSPIGAHIANRRRGNLTQSLLVSTAIGALGTVALVQIEKQGRTDSTGDAQLIGTAIVIPLVQVAVSTWLERRSSR
jgi:hypothetical protein